MARPTKLTPQVQQKIVNALKMGNYFETACRYAGIAPETAYEWIRRGNSTDKRSWTEDYAEFAQAIEKAQADSETALTAQIVKASGITWQAAAWMLERKYYERWGKRQQIDLNIPANVKELLPQLIKEIESAGLEASDVFNAMLAELNEQNVNSE